MSAKRARFVYIVVRQDAPFHRSKPGDRTPVIADGQERILGCHGGMSGAVKHVDMIVESLPKMACKRTPRQVAEDENEHTREFVRRMLTVWTDCEYQTGEKATCRVEIKRLRVR